MNEATFVFGFILYFLAEWTIVMLASLMIGYMINCVIYRNSERAQLDTELIFFYSWLTSTLALTVLLIIFGR